MGVSCYLDSLNFVLFRGLNGHAICEANGLGQPENCDHRSYFIASLNEYMKQKPMHSNLKT
jgi:hypothetical protein